MRAGNPNARASATYNTVCSLQSPFRASSTCTALGTLATMSFASRAYTQSFSRRATAAGSVSSPTMRRAARTMRGSFDWISGVAPSSAAASPPPAYGSV